MAEEKKGFFRRLVSGLTKTRQNIVSGLDSLFHGFSSIDEGEFMRNWKKFLSWEILESKQRMRFSMILERR